MWITLISLSMVLSNSRCFAENTVISPAGPFFLVNNSKLEVTCTTTGDKGAPDTEWRNGGDNIPLKATSDGRIKITYKKNNTLKQTIATLLWNPVYVSDRDISSIVCTNLLKDDSSQFSMFIIPTESVPSVIIQEGPEVNIVSGKEKKLHCEVKAQKSLTVKDVDAKWFVDDIKSKKLSGARAIKKEGKIYTVTSTLDISKLKATEVKHSWVYYCVALLKFKDDFEVVRDFKASTKVTVISDGDVKDSDIEIIKTAGEETSVHCKANSIPIPIITWKKRIIRSFSYEDAVDIPKDKRYTFSTSGVGSSKDNVLNITDIAMSDKAKYVCSLYTKGRNVTQTFTLRVRAPYGAGWPVLGMAIEAILVVIIIYSCQVYNKKKKSNSVEKTDCVADVPAEKEKLLLSSSGNSGVEDGLHQRTAMEVMS